MSHPPPYPRARPPRLALWGFLWHCAMGVPASIHAQPSDVAPPLSGEALARQYCAACHLFPAPELLDRRTWATTTLRRMAPMLGAARLHLDSRPDGAWLREANIFPDHPLLPEADWLAIGRYYVENAPTVALPQSPVPPLRPTTPGFRAQILSLTNVEPAITLVQIDPPDAPRKASWRPLPPAMAPSSPRPPRRLWLGDARRSALHLLSPQGRWIASTPVASPPVRLSQDDTPPLLTLIGDLFPSDSKSGQIVSLHPETNGFSTRPFLSHLKRPVDCVRVDLDADGRKDWVVAEFGNYLGRLTGFLRRDPSPPVEDVLVEFPGAIRTEVVDVESDGLPDLVTLFGQAREGIYLLHNRGHGAFDWVPWLHFPPTYGCTGFELVDFDGNGSPDILLTHGDNGDYPSPFKNYHGIRLFLNDGHHRFAEAWFYPLNGAFKAVARDFDRDGDLDIAAIAFFPDYARNPAESFVYLENLGGLKFEASTLPEANSGRWLTMDAGDLDDDGDLDVVLGSFVDGPRTVPIPPALQAQWQRERVAALLLRNQAVPDR